MRKLFIDNVLYPDAVYANVDYPFQPLDSYGEPDNDWDVVRSYPEFIEYIERNGVPNIISFSYDLGFSAYTGFHCAQCLVQSVMMGVWEFPRDFTYLVHSGNDIETMAIENLLDEFTYFIDHLSQ